MFTEEKRNILSGVTVNEAMRVQVIGSSTDMPIFKGIIQLIKYKTNALLITEKDGSPIGVVSKTDIIGAYYAGLPVESPLSHIMVSPPMFCSSKDSLESALDIMRNQRIYRLYVRDDPEEKIAGVLAYPDIVGLLYGYCRSCDRSIMNRRKGSPETADSARLRVDDVMTSSVMWFYDDDNLSTIMEGLAERRCGAVLIKNRDSIPISVVSKTDLILAYKRGIPSEAGASSILASSRVVACQNGTYLEDAIRKMILTDLQRLFVWSGKDENVIGVISLSDAARIRSGSCHACISSRIKVE